MTFFLYTAVTATGESVRRSGRYADADRLYRELERRGEDLARYVPLPDIFGTLVPERFGAVRPAAVAELCRNLALYAGGGVDMQAVIGAVAAGVKRGAYRRLLQALRARLAEGYRLSEALRLTDAVPPLVVNLARIGEDSGTLPRTLADAAAALERAEAMRLRARRALIYPGFTLAVLLAGLLFWALYVVPRMVELFAVMDIELPALTRGLLAAAAWSAGHITVIGVLVGLAAVALLSGRTVAPLRLALDRAAWHLPFIGGGVRIAQHAFYFQNLTLMYQAGVPLTAAMTSVAEAISNRWFRARLEGVHEAIRAGESLSRSYASLGLFEPLVARMCASGEQTGNLGGQLAHLAEIYTKRADNRLETAGKMLEPVLMTLTAVLLGLFALALLGPLYNIIGNLGRL